MNRIGTWIAFLAGTCACHPSGAQTCSPVGAWTSSAAIGAPTVVASNHTGTFSPTYCPTGFSTVVRLTGNSGLEVVANWSGGPTCQSFTEALTFDATCNVASGKYVSADGSSGTDRWIRQTGLPTTTPLPPHPHGNRPGGDAAD